MSLATAKPKPNLGRRTLVGLFAGLVAGVLLGDTAALLEPLAKGFILLLQMTVIPYMVVALLWGLGRLSPKVVRQVGTLGLLGFLAVWALGLGVVYAASLALPAAGGNSFYSNPAAHASQPEPSTLEILIPANPFQALAAGTVPAIVLFCLLLVGQFLHHPGKDHLLGVLEVFHDAVKSLTGRINALIPYGVFILMASTAGTVTPDVVEKLEFYLVLYVLCSLLLALLILPLAVSLTTPLPLVPLVRRSWGPMALALACGSVFPALPMLTATVLDLAHAWPGGAPTDGEGDEERLESLIPIAYNFPHAGNIISFLFVMFAAGMYGRPLSAGDQLQLVVTGIPALFSGAVYSILFLLQELRLPEDASQLFLDTFNLVARFGSAVGAMTLIAVALWTHYGVTGGLRVRPMRVLPPLAATLLLVAALAYGYGAARPPALPPTATLYERLEVPRKVVTTFVRAEDLPPEPPASGYERLRRTGEIRVGYWESGVPYLYRNAKGELTGYLMALAQQMAEDLDARLVMVQVGPERLFPSLEEGRIDTALGPVLLGPSILGRAGFTHPFLQVRTSLFFHDFDRERVKDSVARHGEGLVLAYPVDSPALRVARQTLHRARFVELPSGAQTGEFPGADALVWTEAEASAHAVLHPMRGVLPLATTVHALPVVLPTRLDDEEFRGLLDSWIEFRQSQVLFQELRRLWLEGQEDKPAPRRRSLLLEWLHVLGRVRPEG